MKALLALALALFALGCSDSASGRCTGTLRGQPFDADIDAESETRTVQRQSCSASNKLRWDLSYGKGAFSVVALSPKPATLLDEVRTYLPDGGWFEEWRLRNPLASTTAGTFVVAKSALFDRTVKGQFSVTLDDGSNLQCTYDLPRGSDEGMDIDCPDEHHDDDDWD